MQTLSKQTYLEKLRGCWLGKAIGGTLGYTFEAQRGTFDLEYYPTPVDNGMIPNDDLDLQLVWLVAAERYKTQLDAEKLGDYWLSSIIPNWAEYGVGKGNLRMGLAAPASGRYANRFKDSNGAWIRSEIWACLAPGHPEIAVKYAMEDALVDHADEGVYAEVFTAALESAAFVESDKFKLIDIALSYIPADCDCAKAVRKMLELHASGIDWKDARTQLLCAFPDSFGGQLGCYDPRVPNGNWGYDAPANVALTLIGWLYGGDDFGRSICITAGCGEDGDCTTGALGALLGIIMGAEGIPAEWKDPIGEEIKTICVNNFVGAATPRTLTELTRRTAALMVAFMGQYVDLTAEDEKMLAVRSGDGLYCSPIKNLDSANGWEEHYSRDEIVTGYTFRGHSPLLDVTAVTDEISIAAGSRVTLNIHMENTYGSHGSVPLHAFMRWITPEGIAVEGGSQYAVFVNQRHCGTGYSDHTVTLAVESVPAPLTNVVCEITVSGYSSKIYLPITLVAGR